MSNNIIEFFIVSSVLLLLLLIGVIILQVFHARKANRQIEELNRVMYTLLQKARVLDDNFFNMKEDVNNLESKINALGSLETKNSNTISSLTSSISNLIQENRKRSEEKIYPTPQLSEMIGATIDEFIRQEITMMRDMRIPASPDNPTTVKITRNVIKTYPHVDEEYLAKRVIQRIEEITRQ